MMIKYRVHEVAKDLNVPSKEIIDLLQKHFGEVKKHMTALTEEELDVIFEHYTQLKALPNFDAYFAENKTVAEDQAAQAAAEAMEKAKAAAAQEPAKAAAKVEKSQQAAKKEAKPAARAEAPVKPAQNASGQPVPNQPKRKAVMPGKITPVGPKPQNQSQPQQKAAQKQQKPAPRQEARQPQAAAPFQNTENSNRVVRPQGRIIDTRSANVNIDKYNEKYDRMASEKYRSENTVQKQKITQKSQQRGFTVVNVSHDHYHRRSGHQVLVVILAVVDNPVLNGDHHFFFYLGVEFHRHQSGGIEIDHIVYSRHGSHHHQLFNDLGRGGL